MKRNNYIIAALLLSVAATLNTTPATAAESAAAGKWDKETLSTFATLPILDGGRVKPLDTYANFLLLRFNSKRNITPPSGEGRINHLEWFLDCLFYPEVAKDYAHFVVDNTDAIATIGATRTQENRDRFSYNDLLPAREKLFTLAQEVQKIENQADRSTIQNTIFALALAVNEFDRIIHYFDFARQNYDTPLGQRFFPDTPDLSLSGILADKPNLQRAISAFEQLQRSGDDTEQVRAAFDQLFQPLDVAFNRGSALALIPPGDTEEQDWLSPAGMVDRTFDVDIEEHNPSDIAILAQLERLPTTLDNPLAFKQALNQLHTLSVNQAKARGEYDKIPLEVSFYKARFFYYAQILFILSFLIAALSWLNIQNKTLNWATIATVTLPLLLLITGITLRSIIRERPPVSTLYETLLFITAVAVAAALFMEYINRQRIAISVATFLGAFGIFLANRYEITNKEDTMPVLVAVLDTNFWLATHVIVINIGYAAGMLAAGISHVYIIGKILRIKRDDKPFYKTITRMVYGTTCFGLITAFIGTVLGGIWANYSWGRFWGWDPKENGAALICLCMLATLHARMGGYIRDLGLHMAAVFTGCVVAFSWWGVNLLGVGLHSYGFTSGIWTITYIFWMTQGFVILLGALTWYRERIEKIATTRQPSKESQEPVPVK